MRFQIGTQLGAILGVLQGDVGRAAGEVAAAPDEPAYSMYVRGL